MLTQVPLLSSPSPWLPGGKLCGMQHRGVTKPLLSSSGSGEPGTRARGPSTLFSVAHFQGSFMFSVSQSFIAILMHASIKKISPKQKFEDRRGQAFPMPAHSQKAPQSIPPGGGSQVDGLKASGLFRGTKMPTWPCEGSQALVPRFSGTLN